MLSLLALVRFEQAQAMYQQALRSGSPVPAGGGGDPAGSLRALA